MNVQLIKIYGDEEFIKTVSGKSHESNGATIKNLIKWGHLSPLEFADVTFLVTAPIFVARQIMRHRTGSYMERSLRYCEANMTFFTPDSSKYGYEMAYDIAYASYQKLLSGGATKEQARAVLPVGLYTSFYMKMDMRNLTHFLQLRTAENTQKETRDVANMMLDLIEPTFPTIAKYIRGEK